MQSVLSVITPALSSDLTILANVKTELGLTDNSEDANIETWIDQASGAIASYCNRVFGSETVAELFRNRDRSRREKPDVLLLDRFPVTAFTSVVEDGVTLVQDTDYEADLATGRLWRLSSTDNNTVHWNFDKLTVTYTGGFQLLGTLPFNVERACITLVKFLRGNASRDPSLKSENILSGLYSYTLINASDQTDGLPLEVQALLAPYRNVSI